MITLKWHITERLRIAYLALLSTHYQLYAGVCIHCIFQVFPSHPKCADHLLPVKIKLNMMLVLYLNKVWLGRSLPTSCNSNWDNQNGCSCNVIRNRVIRQPMAITHVLADEWICWVSMSSPDISSNICMAFCYVCGEKNHWIILVAPCGNTMCIISTWAAAPNLCCHVGDKSILT